MEDMKGAWYGKMRSYSRDHDADARKALEEERELNLRAKARQMGKSGDIEVLQKRMDMDLFK